MPLIPATRTEMDHNYNTVHQPIAAVSRLRIGEAMARRAEDRAEDFDRSADRWEELNCQPTADRNRETAREYRADAAAIREEMRGIV